MKKKILLAAVLALGLIAPDAQMVIRGYKPVARRWVTWGSYGSMRLRIKNRQLFADTNMAGGWKRIDNTADSCSQYFWIADTGGSDPIKYMRFSIGVQAHTVADSTTHAYHVYTREINNYKKNTFFADQPPYRNNGVTGIQVILDTIFIPNVKQTTKARQSSMFFAPGDQAKVCWYALPGMAYLAADSVTIDSMYVETE